jgi:hypothetical protein
MKDKAYSLRRKARNSRRASKAARSTRRYDSLMLNIEAEQREHRAEVEEETYDEYTPNSSELMYRDEDLDGLTLTTVRITSERF